MSLPAQSIALSAAAAPSFHTVQAFSPAPTALTAVAAAPALSAVALAAPAVLSQWADYSPEPVILGFPALPAPDYGCYAPPQVPPGQTRYLKVDEPTLVKNLVQNFNDVRTAVRENNTHIQRNRTQITNVNRNHNHLLRIVTNENNFEHNLTNKIVRVADIHHQKIENLPGERRQFRDFKETQRVEHAGCQRTGVAVVNVPLAATPAPAIAVTPAPALVRTPYPAAPAASLRSATLASSRLIY